MEQLYWTLTHSNAIQILDNVISFDSLDRIHQHHQYVDSTSATNALVLDSTSTISSSSTTTAACDDYLLRLCVGVSLGPYAPHELRGHHHEQEYTKRVLWCLDRGYEYIEVDLSPTGHEDRDKESFPRAIEAMQGTVWSSAVMRKTKTRAERAVVPLFRRRRNNTVPDDDRGSGIWQSTFGAVVEEEEITGYEPPETTMGTS